jgi:hypothetical protein
LVVEIVMNPYYLSTKNTRINVLAQVREFKKTLESYGVEYKVVELDDEHKEFLYEIMEEDYYKLVRFKGPMPDSFEEMLEKPKFMRNAFVIDKAKLKIGFVNSEEDPYSMSVFKPRSMRNITRMDNLSTAYYERGIS